MPSRSTYKVLAEKYDSLYSVNEARVVRQASFTNDELKVLTALYDFVKDRENPAHLRRIVAAGQVEDIIKYSDESFVVMTDDARGTVKKEYKNFYSMCQSLTQIYKADGKLVGSQTPQGQGFPHGMEAGGQGR
jgi:uncharacterized protein YfkK (UPF0435 family)